jgi:hypothetical protein
MRDSPHAAGPLYGCMEACMHRFLAWTLSHSLSHVLRFEVELEQVQELRRASATGRPSTHKRNPSSHLPPTPHKADSNMSAAKEGRAGGGDVEVINPTHLRTIKSNSNLQRPEEVLQRAASWTRADQGQKAEDPGRKQPPKKQGLGTGSKRHKSESKGRSESREDE